VGATQVFDPAKVVLIPDHFVPNKDIKSAQQCQVMRDFAKGQSLTNYFEVGEMGIEHALLPEQGLVLPGDLVVGADSHTCTYGALGAFSTGVGSTDMAAGMASGRCWFRVPKALKFNLVGRPAEFIGGKDVILHLIGLIGVDGASYMSMEFGGPGIAALSMDDRFTMANMAIEAGAKNGIFPADETALSYARSHGARRISVFEPDPDADFEKTFEIDLTGLKPMVAFPHSPANVRPADEAGDVRLDQVVIGSCTNGRLHDLRTAARILKGNKAAKGLRLIILPGTPDVYLKAIEEGLIRIFIDAGAVVGPPTCGPCLGGHMGVLAGGERALATTNRNFKGRMGHPGSQVYLAGPAVAAASAVAGKIVTPEAVLGGA